VLNDDNDYKIGSRRIRKKKKKKKKKKKRKIH
jgi:hypothetical protein